MQFPPPPSFSVHPSTSDRTRLDATNLPVPRGVMSFPGWPDSRREPAGSDSRRPPRATKSATRPLPEDLDLAAVVSAWPNLPDAVRAGILAMVRASDPQT